jgi:hypothetical protein
MLAAGARRVAAPSRPVSVRAEADAAKTTFLQAFQCSTCSGAGMYFWGAASLADVPFWRKTKNRLTPNILTLRGLFLKRFLEYKIQVTHLFTIT